VAKAEGWYRQEWENSADFEWRGRRSPGGGLGPIKAGPRVLAVGRLGMRWPDRSSENVIGVTRRPCGALGSPVTPEVDRRNGPPETSVYAAGTTFLVASDARLRQEKFVMRST